MHQVSKAGGVGVVLLDGQFRFVIEQTVENVSGIAHGHADHFGVERRVSRKLCSAKSVVLFPNP